jgi:hypothetical protein
LHHYVRSIAERARILGEVAKGDHAMPFGSTMPSTVRVLPGLFSVN